MTEAFLQEFGTRTIWTYVDGLQAKVAKWVSARPVFDVCAIYTGYEGGGRLRAPWWRQKVEEDQLRVTVEAILEAARVRRRQESGRWDRSKGG